MKILLFEEFSANKKLEVGKTYILKSELVDVENNIIPASTDIEAGAEITITKIKGDYVEFTVEPISNGESWTDSKENIIKAIYESNSRIKESEENVPFVNGQNYKDYGVVKTYKLIHDDVAEVKFANGTVAKFYRVGKDGDEWVTENLKESVFGETMKPKDLKIGEKYTWFMGASPLECTYTEFDEDRYRYKFRLGRSEHWLSMRDVKEYIYPYSVYLESK